MVIFGLIKICGSMIFINNTLLNRKTILYLFLLP